MQSYVLPIRDGVAFFGRLWRAGPLLPQLLWTGQCPALAIGGEVAQLAGWLPGTWDPADVLCYGLAGGVALWFALWAPARRAEPRGAR